MGKETLIVENVGIKFNLSEEKVDDFNQSPIKQMWDLYNESEKISKTPLKELLNKEATNTTIDEVYLRLCDLCEYGYELDQINDYQRIFWFIYNFNGETGNGGVEQFLYNCHDQVDITLQTLQDVHLENSTRYLAESKEICPEKIEMYSNDEITEKLNQKDDTYYDESEKLIGQISEWLKVTSLDIDSIEATGNKGMISVLNKDVLCEVENQGYEIIKITQDNSIYKANIIKDD